ncbi:ArsR/SmtB family transcription factor [Goodfellowiella coeruleoviolacea]|uniref:ArsR/SmtB family transcription factor n=1 Tax=Goodfellowiella coeruleoviolacea TaxID=334858 RepID=UPI0020A31939|nr:metalloregulator ArsR/SmtB family transcription factor [Goodfellowiella coeruleoviolacea]
MADDTRRAVLSLLSEHGELTVTQIAEQFTHIGRTAVSMQLRVLRDAGLVKERRAGKYRYYSLRVEPVHEVISFLNSLYGASLDGLARAAEASADQEPAAASDAPDPTGTDKDTPRWGISY